MLIKSVVAFGKMQYVPKDESVPLLPEMSLLFMNDGGQEAVFPWRAICIDLEIDACGGSIEDAAENLKETLSMYIDMEQEAAGGSIVEAAKTITRTAFMKTRQKKHFIDLYQKAKEKYIMQINNDLSSEEAKEAKQRPNKSKINERAFSAATNDSLWNELYQPSAIPFDVKQFWSCRLMPSSSSKVLANFIGMFYLKNAAQSKPVSPIGISTANG